MQIAQTYKKLKHGWNLKNTILEQESLSQKQKLKDADTETKQKAV